MWSYISGGIRAAGSSSFAARRQGFAGPSKTETMPPDLCTPLDLRGTAIPNRLIMSPMCQYSVEAGEGLATPWHHVHLSSRAVGGAGLVIAEATAVEPRGRITPQDLGSWSDEHADALADTAAFVAPQGAVPGVQLAYLNQEASPSL
jgi:2,4-dienoyl-CoA reductase-like NADH-dependent reductase (Old Yellow Enzyme family)